MERLVVDAMNVIGSRPTGWWRDRSGAVARLVRDLSRLADDGADVTVVVDGRPARELPEGEHGGVTVLYARRSGRNAADDHIVELVEGDTRPASLTVVTADRELRGRVGLLGAALCGPRRLLDRLG